MAEKNNYKYKKSFIEEVDKYLATKVDKKIDGVFKVNLPSIEDFAISWLKVSKKSVYNWQKDHKSFYAALDKIRNEQKQRLITQGLAGNYNSTIAKLILSSDHGMRERSDVTTDDEPISAFTDEQTDRIAERIASRKAAVGGNAGK
jgi:hypothetical protein